MPLFQYKAYDQSGSETSGVIKAEDRLTARQLLRSSGLMPFAVELAVEESGLGFSKNFSLAEQARFSRQLAALLRGGVPLTKALSGIEAQAAWQNRRSIIVQLREEIEKGRDLSTVIGELQTIFSPSLQAVIRVGETTGKLDYAFAQLAAHLDREIEQRRRFIAAIAYPSITAIIAVGVLAFLMTYLVPTVAKMFADVQGELPWITRALITISDFFRTYWFGLGISAFALLAFVHFAMKVDSFRRHLEKLTLKLPIWGRFIESMRMERWARNTGMMIECGVTLLEAVRVLKENNSSLLQYDALSSVEKALERGVSFSDALKSANFFPIFLIQMIEAGEASGELAPMLHSAAKELEADNRIIAEMFLNILEPLLIVVMGLVVGTIMIGVLLPIYEMNRYM